MRQQKDIRQFYIRTLQIAIPIMIQNGISNFVSMLDNLMVGRIGTDPMSGVAIVNQLIFVWDLCFFGGLAGIGIFTAQFYGKGDQEGIRYTVRLQLMTVLALLAAGFFVFLRFGTPLISLYLHSDGGAGDVAATLRYAHSYLLVMLIGMVPLSLTHAYAMTLRSTGETLVPMRASLAAMAVNLAGNYILIYGKFGAPALGVVGAALATVISRFVEASLVLLHTHRHTDRYPFMTGLYRSLYVPAGLVRNCLTKGAPLLMNETLWSAAQAVLTRNYSLRGLSVVAAFNISQTISNVFNVAFISMGSAIAIIIGQELGTGRMDTVRRDANRLTVFSLLLCAGFGSALFAISGIFPNIYNTSPEIRQTASGLIRIAAVCMPMYAYENCSYFIIRSGGKTLITFLFDSCFCWIVSIPLSYFLVRYTRMPVLSLYLAVQLAELVKCGIGFILIRMGIWINNITEYRRD